MHIASARFTSYTVSHSIPIPILSQPIHQCPILSPFYPHSIPMSLKIRHPKIKCFIIMFLIYPYIRTMISGGVTPFVRHIHSTRPGLHRQRGHVFYGSGRVQTISREPVPSGLTRRQRPGKWTKATLHRKKRENVMLLNNQ